MIDPKQIAEWREIMRAATSRPWIEIGRCAHSEPLLDEFKRIEKTIPDDAPESEYDRLPDTSVFIVDGRGDLYPTVRGQADLAAIVTAVNNFEALIDECDRLTARQQELLATIVRVTNETPFADEASDALRQRGALLAEIGTMRASLAATKSALKEACDLAEEGWAYAGEYFQQKWDCAGKIAELRAIGGNSDA